MKGSLLSHLFIFCLLLCLLIFTEAKKHDDKKQREEIKKLIESKRIQNFVILMLENRSFDHMCGFLHKINPEIEGLRGNETNPYNPLDPSLGTATVTNTAPYYVHVDPHHDFPNTTDQLYGYAPPVNPPPMNGFVYNYYLDGDIDERGAGALRMFDPANIPAFSTLATEFAVFDHWYASIPGPTFPNRLFVASATSYGATVDDVDQVILGYPQKTIFDNLSEANYTWADYWGDFPTLLMFESLREYPENFRDYDEFHQDARFGRLPQVSYLEPRFTSILDWEAADEHPTHNVLYGEYLIKHVYESLRASPQWNSTLLIITFDEHGGFFDHVPPPQTGVPAPDNHTTPASQFPFNFERLGLRVPTIMVSPWINKGSVVHEPTGPGATHYEHSSIAGTIKKNFDLPNYLTKRDEWASTFESVWSKRTEPRTDCPLTVPIPGGDLDHFNNWAKLELIGVNEDSIAQALKKRNGEVGDSAVISDFQQTVVAIASGLDLTDKNDFALLKEKVVQMSGMTEFDASLFIHDQFKKWKVSKQKKST